MNLKNLWDPGFIIDKNRTSMDFSVVDQPIVRGMLDFYCRVGFELLANDISYISNEEATYELKFIKNDNITKVESVDNTILFYYENAEKLNSMLVYLSSDWNAESVKDSAFIHEIIFLEKEIIINDTSYPTVKNFTATEFQKVNIDSINDFWNDSGLLCDGNVDLDHIVNIFLEVDSELLTSNFEVLCKGALRIGIESSNIILPLTELSKDKCEYELCKINILSDEINKISLEDNELFLYMTDENKHVLNYFFLNKHYRLSHETNYEKVFIKDEEIQDTIDFKWEIDGEINRAKRALSSVQEQEITEVYLSKPYETREAFKMELNLDAQVRSSYKTAYFWIKEEIIPELLTIKDVKKIQISVKSGKVEGYLELKNRWLQEMYPADILINQHLSVSTEDIHFMIDSNQEETYILEVFNSNQELLYSSSLNVPVSPITYLGYEEKSLPSTSAIVRKNSIEVIRSDRELFYEKYILEILPEVWDLVKVNVKNHYTLFDSLIIKIDSEDIEEHINIDNENISSMEALHEDIYFNTLDYFSKKAEEEFGVKLNSPGSVLPFLKVVKSTNTKVSIQLTHNNKSEPYKMYQTKKLVFGTETDSPLKAILLNKFESIEYHFRGIESNNGRTNEYPVWLVEESFRGNQIEVYEIFKENRFNYYSPRKLSTFRPTIIIEAGHHPNEVSSVYAVDKMIENIQLSNNTILEEVNLVFIKCANPDSYITQESLASDNPYWKHHAARFNSVGIEFSELQFKNTYFGEANVLPKIVSRWLPDIHIDNHGIPNHEWTQPFAGYHVPPRFSMSYWIPNSFLYGLGRLPEVEDLKKTKILDYIEQRLSEGFKDTAIEKTNKYWKTRYFKYGAQFLPSLFQIDMNQSFIFYKWKKQSNNTAGSLIDRFPKIISAEIISEVADETVYDTELLKCIEAQVSFNMKSIDWIKRENQKYFNRDKDGVLRRMRERPLRINNE